jgi:phosphoribosyl 1,2-cyclic phosphate phosphodiesterase
MDGLHVQVDAAPEFRVQCVREGVDRLDLFILTHGHSGPPCRDGRPAPVLRPARRAGAAGLHDPEGLARVRAIYPYAIMEKAVVRGYPAFTLAEMPPDRAAPGNDPVDAPAPRRRGDDRACLHGAEQRRKSSPTTRIASGCTARRSRWPGAPTRRSWTGSGRKPHPSHMSIGEAVEAGKGLGRSGLAHPPDALDRPCGRFGGAPGRVLSRSRRTADPYLGPPFSRAP